MKYAIFQSYIVTANADGTVPLNAKCVCKIEEADTEALAKLIELANLGDHFSPPPADNAHVAEGCQKFTA